MSKQVTIFVLCTLKKDMIVLCFLFLMHKIHSLDSNINGNTGYLKYSDAIVDCHTLLIMFFLEFLRLQGRSRLEK